MTGRSGPGLHHRSHPHRFFLLLLVENKSRKGELNRKLTYECRCDERLKTSLVFIMNQERES